MSYQFTQSFARVQLSAALRRVSFYFCRVPVVWGFDDFDIYGWPLAKHLRTGWTDALVFSSLGWWARACLALVLAVVQVAIGVAFKVAWLLVLGLEALLYAGRFDFERYHAACAALDARRGEVQP